MQLVTRLVLASLAVHSLPVAAQTGVATAPSQDPEYAWLCDEGGGTAIVDRYVFAQHGILKGAAKGAPPGWSVDVPFPYPGNYSLALDGEDDHVLLATKSLASGHTDYSVSLWFWSFAGPGIKDCGIYDLAPKKWTPQMC